MTAISLLTGCGEATSAAKPERAKTDISRIDTAKYDNFDAAAVAKEFLGIVAFSGDLKKKVEEHGGLPALIGQMEDIAAKEKRPASAVFRNFFLLRDGLVAMGASPETLAAFAAWTRKAHNLSDMSAEEFVGLLPTVAKLHQGLSDIGAPAEDLMDGLWEYVSSKGESRDEKSAKLQESIDRFARVRDVLTKAGLKKSDVQKGLGKLAFPHASDLSKKDFRNISRPYSRMTLGGIEALAPDCAKMASDLRRVGIGDDQIVEGLVMYLAAPEAERPRMLKGIAEFCSVFAEKQKSSGDIAAAAEAFDAMMSKGIRGNAR